MTIQYVLQRDNTYYVLCNPGCVSPSQKAAEHCNILTCRDACVCACPVLRIYFTPFLSLVRPNVEELTRHCSTTVPLGGASYYPFHSGRAPNPTPAHTGSTPHPPVPAHPRNPKLFVLLTDPATHCCCSSPPLPAPPLPTSTLLHPCPVRIPRPNPPCQPLQLSQSKPWAPHQGYSCEPAPNSGPTHGLCSLPVSGLARALSKAALGAQAYGRPVLPLQNKSSREHKSHLPVLFQSSRVRRRCGDSSQNQRPNKNKQRTSGARTTREPPGKAQAHPSATRKATRREGGRAGENAQSRRT
jgi:hypothetical protein